LGKQLASLISLAGLYQLATQRSLHLYRANQHGLPLETVIMRESVVSEFWSERTCS